MLRSAIWKGAFYRGDYHHGAFLALLFLGLRLREGVVYRFVDLAKVSNARFLQRALFFCHDLPAPGAARCPCPLHVGGGEEHLAPGSVFSHLLHPVLPRDCALRQGGPQWRQAGL